MRILLDHGTEIDVPDSVSEYLAPERTQHSVCVTGAALQWFWFESTAPCTKVSLAPQTRTVTLYNWALWVLTLVQNTRGAAYPFQIGARRGT